MTNAIIKIDKTGNDQFRKIPNFARLDKPFESILDISLLRPKVEWDDTVAAEKYRLQQARNIVCNLVYQEEKKEEPTKLRVFYSQSSTNTYQPTRVLVRNEDNYKELLMQAKAELRAFKNKYKMLTELEDIFNLID